MSERLIHIFHQGQATQLVRSAKHSQSVYGGPFEFEVKGHAPLAPLHNIATISAQHLKALRPMLDAFEIPLVYGLLYSDCRLRYQFAFDSLTVQSIEPEVPAVDWPYRYYPLLLPYIPLEACAIERESWETFSKRVPNLSKVQPAELVVLVPPPATIGFSMWGRLGDAEDVTLVFECSLKVRTIVAYNVCN